MAHFAQLDENNIVLQVIVVGNQDILNENNEESEELGIQFCQNLLGVETQWVQTSYNNNFRKNYAGQGYSYDADRDAFIPPQPYPSWTLNEERCDWDPPVPPGPNQFIWDEENQRWLDA